MYDLLISDPTLVAYLGWDFLFDNINFTPHAEIMKNFALILLALCSISAQAAIIGAPFQPETDNRFNSIESGYVQYPGGVVANQVGSSTYPVSIGSMRKIAPGRSTMSFVKYTAKGNIALSGNAVNVPISTNVNIPADAIITQVYFYIAEKILPSGTSIAVQCMGAGDILAAIDKTASAANTVFPGVEVGTAGTMLYVNSYGCSPKALLGGNTATGGVVEMFVDYVMAQ